MCRNWVNQISNLALGDMIAVDILESSGSCGRRGRHGNKVEILNIIRRVVKEHHVAAVMTLHDLNTAFRYSDKRMFLQKETNPLRSFAAGDRRRNH